METFKLELTLEELNGIMGALGNLPYVTAAPLIAKVTEQAKAQQLGVETVDTDKE